MKVTVCELSDDRKSFASEWEKLAKHARREKSDLVLLPEMPFSSWFCAAPRFDPKVWGRAVAEHSKWVERLPELGAPVVMGTSPVEREGRRVNEGFVWTKEHGARGVQFKNYLPNETGFFEASWYERGDRSFSPFEVGGWSAGFLICSDLWSLSSARALGKSGVHIMAVPRATGRGSLDKWMAGGKAAAVVSGAYCASSNRVGKKGAADFGGRGWVIDPDGEVLGQTSKARPFSTVEVDLRKAEKSKKSYPRNALEPD